MKGLHSGLSGLWEVPKQRWLLSIFCFFDWP